MVFWFLWNLFFRPLEIWTLIEFVLRSGWCDSFQFVEFYFHLFQPSEIRSDFSNFCLLEFLFFTAERKGDAFVLNSVLCVFFPRPTLILTRLGNRLRLQNGRCPSRVQDLVVSFFYGNVSASIFSSTQNLGLIPSELWKRDSHRSQNRSLDRSIHSISLRFGNLVCPYFLSISPTVDFVWWTPSKLIRTIVFVTGSRYVSKS